MEIGALSYKLAMQHDRYNTNNIIVKHLVVYDMGNTSNLKSVINQWMNWGTLFYMSWEIMGYFKGEHTP